MPESNNNFVHLRLHTEYSITDGVVTINPLVEKVAQLGMSAVAITDRENLFGFIKFYTSAIAAGLKPVCGCDVLVRNGVDGVSNRLVLLVRNATGYANLTRLISRAYVEKPTHPQLCLDKDWLADGAEGLIALSGARDSDIARALLEGDRPAAESLLKQWMGYFPRNCFYLELQRTGRAQEEQYIQAVVSLAADTGCPVVATNDVRFLARDDFDAHEVRVCINERRTLDDPRRPHLYSEQQYLRSPEEMSALFADIPEAIENTVEIARRCSLTLELGKPYLPNYPVPAGQTVEDFFCAVSRQGLDRRLASSLPREDGDRDAVTKTYHERLQFELNIINQMGFAGYFLIVMEFIQWARDNDIPVGPGRGSGAGSIVAYALGITDLDPLRYDLLFERFLNPERVSMPDFDVDFCMEGRDRVIQHVAELYGKEAVSQIITFGTMAAKAVVRDVARVQGKSYGLADKLSKLIPFEPGMTLHKALEQEPQLGEFIDSDEDAQEIMEMAFKLEGITRNVGKHAGGVVIAPTKLTDFTPLYCDDNGEGLVTQFDKNDVETVGLVKFDFLGLRTLTIIDWAVKMINRQVRGPDSEHLDITELPLDDASVYEMLQSGETTAIFQLESRGMKDLIKRLQPNGFEDMIALVALFRPGPLQSGMVDDYINRKHGREKVFYPHPDLKSVLGNTYGVILYQEQVMKIAQVLANYTLGGADMLRRAMGKKKQEEMDKQRSLFMAGAKVNGIEGQLAGSIFDLMEKFAGYGFNKSHSAAYALVSYQTAWLKVHYPAYFMAAVLTADMQNTDKLVTLIDECRSMKIPLARPDVNAGEYNFTVNDSGEIVYALGAIKGLGEGPVNSIIAARSDGIFTSLLDFCTRVDARSVNKRTMEALIRSGAMDGLLEGEIDLKRACLMANLPETVQAAEQSCRNQDSGVADMFGAIEPEPDTPASLGHRAARPWSQKQRLAAELEALGLHLSGHPIDEYLPELDKFTRARLANLRPEREPQLVAGLVHTLRSMKSKRGDTIAFVELDDRSARMEVSFFAKEYEQFRDKLHKHEILVVECLVSVDDYHGGVRGRAREAMTLTEARRKFARRLGVSLSADELTSGFCEQLAQILQPYKCVRVSGGNGSVVAVGAAGDHGLAETAPAAGCPVVIHYHRKDAKGCIMLGDDWTVSLDDELIQRLKSEYGKDRVMLDYS
ncbi:MAG: DNA polymerase III subunit alpha [Pseudohongiellaceae bacterium]